MGTRDGGKDDVGAGRQESEKPRASGSPSHPLHPSSRVLMYSFAASTAAIVVAPINSVITLRGSSRFSNYAALIHTLWSAQYVYPQYAELSQLT